MSIVLSVPQPITIDTAVGWGQTNGAWLKKIIDEHKAWVRKSEIDRKQALYDGVIDSIDDRDKDRGDSINNKLVANYAQIIIDTITDYMGVNSITYEIEPPKDENGKVSAEDEAHAQLFKQAFLRVAHDADTRRVQAEQLRQGCIAHYSGVFVWINEDGEIDREEYPVQEVVPVYDRRGRLIMVVRYYEIEQEADGGLATKTAVEVYDDRYTTYYISDETGGEYVLDDSEAETGNPYEHKAGRIPVSLFVNGIPASYKDRQGRLGTSDLGNGVITLLEDLSHKLSDKANLAEYLLDQYLLLIGVDTDENEVVKMRKARALLLKGDKNVSDARFISQEFDDAAIENHFKRLKEAIYETTFTPRISELSGATATEIKMKYADLDIKANKKELYYMPALKQFIRITVNLLNAKQLLVAGLDDDAIYEVLKGDRLPPSSVRLYDADWVLTTITRNLPQNWKEIADIVAMLAGVAPDSYLLPLLWFVDDPEDALAEMKKQKDENAKRDASKALDVIGYGGEFGDKGNGDGDE